VVLNGDHNNDTEEGGPDKAGELETDYLSTNHVQGIHSNNR